MKAKFRIEFTPRFRRRLKALDRAVQIQILRQIKGLEKSPYVGKPLRGVWKGIYSLRIGDYRLLYKIADERVFLLTVGHRKAVYGR